MRRKLIRKNSFAVSGWSLSDAIWHRNAPRSFLITSPLFSPVRDRWQDTSLNWGDVKVLGMITSPFASFMFEDHETSSVWDRP